MTDGYISWNCEVSSFDDSAYRVPVMTSIIWLLIMIIMIGVVRCKKYLGNNWSAR